MDTPWPSAGGPRLWGGLHSVCLRRRFWGSCSCHLLTAHHTYHYSVQVRRDIHAGYFGACHGGILKWRSITKGVAAALLGLLISTIGSAQTVAIYRYTFGQDYLLDGRPLFPSCLAFRDTRTDGIGNEERNISRFQKNRLRGGMLDGIRDAFRHRCGNTLRHNWYLSVYCPGLAQLLWTGSLMGMRFNHKTRVSLARAIFAALRRGCLMH